MTEAKEVDLKSFSRTIPVGWKTDGSAHSIDLGSSHGLIVCGGCAEKRKRFLRDICLAAAKEPGLKILWCAKDSAAAPAFSSFVPEDEIQSLLKRFRSEQMMRYEMMKKAGSNNLPHYNAFAGARNLEILPFKLLVIENYENCGEKFGRPLTDQICTIARYGRACGMVPVVSTGDASPEKLSSLLKAEIADRVCLGASSRRESLSLLGVAGGELTGEKEALFRHAAGSEKAVPLLASAPRGEFQ